jgi:hypothetical protein
MVTLTRDEAVWAAQLLEAVVAGTLEVAVAFGAGGRLQTNVTPFSTFYGTTCRISQPTSTSAPESCVPARTSERSFCTALLRQRFGLEWLAAALPQGHGTGFGVQTLLDLCWAETSCAARRSPR